MVARIANSLLKIFFSNCARHRDMAAVSMGASHVKRGSFENRVFRLASLRKLSEIFAARPRSGLYRQREAVAGRVRRVRRATTSDFFACC